MSAGEHPRASPLGTFLEGVRILDLSQYLPGPMATLFLADMGAEVLKIEPPAGDDMQALGPRDASGQPIFYRTLNAGKTIRRMNLKDPVQRGVFLELVETADIVVEGFRPGVLDRLGIGYAALRAANPAIILCSISGYGAGTGLSAKAGHDSNYLALSGTLHRNGTDRPIFFDPPVSDSAGSLFAAIAMLGALHRRGRTGEGCTIDLALADVAMPLQMNQVAAFGSTGANPGRGETYLNGGAAYYRVYSTQDGRHIALGAVEPKFWRAFCEAADRADWVARHADPLPQHDLQSEVSTYFATLSAAEMQRRFNDVDCCVSLINDLGEAIASAHVLERKLVCENGDGDLQALFPAWVDGSPPAERPSIRFVSPHAEEGVQPCP